MSIRYALKKLSLASLCVLFSAEAYATCPREDVAYYLQQGFNHQQIVTLCSEQAKPSYQKPYTPINETPPQIVVPKTKQQAPLVTTPAVIRDQATGIYANPDAVFLATAIEAYDVEVTENTIMFTRKDCFSFGQEDWNEFKNSACPTVKYTIVRGGLEVLERDNGFFGLGSTALYISGNIRADILDLEEFKQRYHQDIKRIVQQNTEKLKIDVRSGMPQSKVEAIFLKLAGS